MELLIAAVLASWIGQAAGWWGPWFSSKSGGGRAGASGGSGGTTTCGPEGRGGGPTKGSGGVRRLGSWLGNASGWNGARRDGKAIVDREDPPATWGQAWREGLESGKQRGRDRFHAGQQAKAEKLAERDAQRDWLKQAQARSPEDPLAPRGLAGRWDSHVERVRTCPDCGHGNRWNDNRESCPCKRDYCACGTDAAPIGRDDEDDRPDLSQPPDDEQRWGGPEEVADPVDEVAEKRRERDPEPTNDPRHPDYVGAPHPTEFDEHDPPAPTGDGTPEIEETDVSAPTAPTPGLSGEIINFDSAREVLRGISSEMGQLSDEATETAAKHRATVARCDAAIAGLTQIDSDPDTIGDFLSLREQAQQALDAAERAQVESAESSAYALTVVGNIDQRHGGIEEAVRAAKHAAKIDAYRAS